MADRYRKNQGGFQTTRNSESDGTDSDSKSTHMTNIPIQM